MYGDENPKHRLESADRKFNVVQLQTYIKLIVAQSPVN